MSMHPDDLLRCHACLDYFLPGAGPDSHHCSPECKRETRRAEVLREHEEMMQRHGPASIELWEHEMEHVHDNELMNEMNFRKSREIARRCDGDGSNARLAEGATRPFENGVGS